jgi:hypothetical protein
MGRLAHGHELDHPDAEPEAMDPDFDWGADPEDEPCCARQSLGQGEVM